MYNEVRAERRDAVQVSESLRIGYRSAAKKRGGGTSDVLLTEPPLVNHFPVPFLHEPFFFGSEGIDPPGRRFGSSQKVLHTRFKVFWVQSVDQARDTLHHTPSKWENVKSTRAKRVE